MFSSASALGSHWAVLRIIALGKILEKIGWSYTIFYGKCTKQQQGIAQRGGTKQMERDQ